MRIGVLSDTHLRSPGEARILKEIADRHFQEVDTILHAGDLVNCTVIESALSDYRLIAVSGNMDDAITRQELPVKRVIKLGGYRIGMVHGWGPPNEVAEKALSSFEDVDCVIFGHSHHPMCEKRGDVLLFNPGSPTDKRFAPHRSIGILHVGERLEGELISLEDR